MAKETICGEQTFMICSRDDEADVKLFELAEFVRKFGVTEQDKFYGEFKTIYFFTEKEEVRQLELDLETICKAAGIPKTYDSQVMVKYEALFDNDEPYRTMLISLPGKNYDKLLGSKNGSKFFEQRSVQVTVL